MGLTTHLYTLGYEGQDVQHFVRPLIDTGVQTVVDVRELPLSRKRGFSKRALAENLADHGIHYVHVPTLGCPKAIRDRLKVDGDWARYVRDFLAHLSRQDAAVAEIASRARKSTCGLLCFEADYTRCHRTLVARAANRVGAPAILHITPQAVVPDTQ